MPRAKLILLGRFPGPHQIAQRLVIRVRHPYRCQFSRPIIPRQLQRIPPIRLHPSPAFTGTNVGATTSHGAPILLSCQYNA